MRREGGKEGGKKIQGNEKNHERNILLNSNLENK